MSNTKKIRVPFPETVKGRSLKWRYMMGDRSAHVVAAWNAYVRDKKAGRIEPRPSKAKVFDPSKLKKPITDYSAQYLHSLGCREPWVLAAVARKQAAYAARRRLEVQAELEQVGKKTVRTWKESK